MFQLFHTFILVHLFFISWKREKWIGDSMFLTAFCCFSMICWNYCLLEANNTKTTDVAFHQNKLLITSTVVCWRHCYQSYISEAILVAAPVTDCVHCLSRLCVLCCCKVIMKWKSKLLYWKDKIRKWVGDKISGGDLLYFCDCGISHRFRQSPADAAWWWLRQFAISATLVIILVAICSNNLYVAIIWLELWFWHGLGRFILSHSKAIHKVLGQMTDLCFIDLFIWRVSAALYWWCGNFHLTEPAIHLWKIQDLALPRLSGSPDKALQSITTYRRFWKSGFSVISMSSVIWDLI